MFKTILLPLDLTDKHEPALKLAVEMAGRSSGEIVLVHVIETMAGLPYEEERPFYDRLRRAAEAHLARYGKQLEERSVRWRSQVLLGSRIREVLRCLVDVKADLVLLTSPRVEPENLAGGWGSLSYKISLVAPCPVLLVK
jgi:nucleotide-binding universal stress UspA family protein